MVGIFLFVGAFPRCLPSLIYCHRGISLMQDQASLGQGRTHRSAPTKAKLRRQLSQTALAIALEKRLALAQAATELFAPWFLKQNFRRVALYRDLVSEMATGPLALFLRSQKVKLAYPRLRQEVLDFVYMEPGSPWERGPFGLMEPAQTLPAAPVEFDLLIVPALAVDRQGCRLGKGKGYYDRFLQKHPLKTMALIYDFQYLEKIPRQPHDQAVDWVLTNQVLEAVKA